MDSASDVTVSEASADAMFAKGKGRVKVTRCDVVVLDQAAEAVMPIAKGETILKVQGGFDALPDNVRVHVNGALIYDGSGYAKDGNHGLR